MMLFMFCHSRITAATKMDTLFNCLFRIDHHFPVWLQFKTGYFKKGYKLIKFSELFF